MFVVSVPAEFKPLEPTFTVDIEHTALDIVANDLGGILVNGYEVTQRVALIRDRVLQDADDEAGGRFTNDFDIVLEVIGNRNRSPRHRHTCMVPAVSLRPGCACRRRAHRRGRLEPAVARLPR